MFKEAERCRRVMNGFRKSTFKSSRFVADMWCVINEESDPTRGLGVS